jgi:regulator of protease activity HflC (stomatin/prohibitin superfamily)
MTGTQSVVVRSVSENPNSRSLVPQTFTGLFGVLAALWIAVVLAALILSFFSIALKFAAASLFLTGTGIVGRQAWQLLGAKRRVLVKKYVPVLWGRVGLVAWDPVEGVLFLRNKAISFVDDQLEDARGGIRCIYPDLGDELALIVPLETQTLKFADDKVLTREYLSVTIRGSMKWKITDLKRYYLQVSRELRSTGKLADGRESSYISTTTGDNGSGVEATSTKLMASSIEWLRLLAEERTRTVVSRVSSGLLIADRVYDSLGSGAGGPQSELARLAGIPSAVEGNQTAWRSAAETLSQSIAQTISEGVADTGISIVSVSLQEIQLPEEVVARCIEAAQAAYLPLLAQRQAAVKRADLSADVDLLGKEAVGTREIVGAAPPFALVDFLSQFVTKQLGKSPAAGAGLASVGLVAAAAEAAPQVRSTGEVSAPPS